ncbi:MAG: hypothetical protein L6R28_21555 [Planctomycetes bacterium]|nr:hypothetical protein [Planctomycetota bacterium]
MQPGTEKERSPVLATCLGCLAMSVIPLAAMAVLVGAVYMYLEQPDQEEQEREYLEQAERERQNQAAKEVALTGTEQRQLEEEIERLGSTDEALRRKAEIRLADFSTRKPQGVCDVLSAMLRQSRNAQQIVSASGFLCRFHRDTGVALICAQVTERRDDPLFLRAVREGVMSVENLTLRERTLNRIVSTLERANSVYAGTFYEL